MAAAAAAAAKKKAMLCGGSSSSSLAGLRQARSLCGGSSSSSLAGPRRAGPLRGGLSWSSLVAGLPRSPGARLHSVSFLKEMKQYRHVSGRFESNSSKFVLFHLSERLNTISVYLRTANRHWAYPVLNLIGALMMISPLMLDYRRVRNVDSGLRDLQAEMAQAQNKSQAMDRVLHIGEE